MAILCSSETRIAVLAESGALRAPSAFPSFYASNVVAQVTADSAPAGHWLLDSAPRYPSLAAALAESGATATVILGSASFAAEAALEATAAGAELVVVAGGEFSADDRQRLRAALRDASALVLGPGNPAVVTPGECHIGSYPAYLFAKGRVGILSDAGAVTAQAALQTSAVGLGQSSVVDFGAGPLDPSAFARCLEAFLDDEASEAVLLLCDAEGPAVEAAVRVLQARPVRKPIVAYLAARRNPVVGAPGVYPLALGQAARKMQALQGAGVSVEASPANLGWTVKAALERAWTGAEPQGTADFVSAMRRVEREIYGAL